ncbi:peptide deformylase [Ligilactobacillus sp. WILCCON 0076]|uniref:Peptide deformylase n=1 Tax=Ligilactobacillus ubinensis TaxID=2876789 RepID=A0A9X2FI88_9LACO|nr:peptide deformylase [Ligilactobacillus ubinensis]MCP0886130.1 peptide deformylase [Ligilactobacillus ubinensis]
MIRKIVRDEFFLSQKSTDATSADIAIIQDLKDTLVAYQKNCVGMAANMIGVKKNIIIVSLNVFNIIMINPKITKKLQPYLTEEGCLSLDGARQTKRYSKIEVVYLNDNFKTVKQVFAGTTAQIIQHEIDHCNGKLI